jgi:hypothetical protein
VQKRPAIVREAGLFVNADQAELRISDCEMRIESQNTVDQILFPIRNLMRRLISGTMEC